MGQGPTGIVFQIFFELISLVTFIIATYKLVIFVTFKGIALTVPQICLTLEIIAATCKYICACCEFREDSLTFSHYLIVRMLWMIQPLSFYGFLLNPLADSLLLGYSNDISFMTDLLITFYW